MNAARLFFSFFVVCLGLGRGLPSYGQLAATSPFLPPGAAPGGGASASAETLELRGIMSTSDGLRFCIYDAAKRSSAWVGLNEDGHEYVVKEADPSHDTVTLQDAGRTFTIALHEARITALIGSGIVLPTREPGAFSSMRAITPAEEAHRLEAVAAEVRQRRLLREQADQAQDRAAELARERQRQ